MMHAGKWEGLGGEIMCGQLRNHFAQQGVELYMNNTEKTSKGVTSSVLHVRSWIQRD